jgi:pimeloyl-ACP methyl ester carboxylesterase/DNA-binding CsgD family transcriptional regulator
MDQTIRFTTAGDGTRLAFATSGSGPPLLKTANWLNHLEFDWQSPVWLHWFRLLTRHHLLCRYDARGTGLSEWIDTRLGFEYQVDDLERVADAAGLERFALLGISQGASVAIEYAVRHPERVSHLIIHGGFASGWALRGERTARAERAMVELIRVGWGAKSTAFRRLFAELLIPEASEEQTLWITELQRRTTTPEIAARIMEACGAIDVEARLTEVRAPTLVLHPRGDLMVAREQGHLIASRIPGAQFVELESRNHVTTETEPAWQRLQLELGTFLGWTDKSNIGSAMGADVAFPALTPREREILSLVASGTNNQEIAGKIFISERTVRNHLTMVFEKLGVSSRAQAIVLARDHGQAGHPH